MLSQTRIRQVLILATLVLTLAALVLVLWGAQLTLAMWRDAMQLPWPLLLGFILLLSAIAVGGLWLSLRFWRSRPVAKKPPASRQRLSTERLQQQLKQARLEGVDTAQAEQVLQAALDAHTALSIAVFGEVSSGKSSLIKALAPETNTHIDVLAGSTETAERHQWQVGEQAITLIDMPGTAHAVDDTALMDQARQADLVLMVCDNDLTAHEAKALRALHELDKPLILVLNKVDQLSKPQHEALQTRLEQRLNDMAVPMASVAAGRREKQIIERADGQRETVWRDSPPDIADLLAAIHEQLSHGDQLKDLGQQARLALTLDYLQRSQNKARHQAGEALVRRYARRAMVGALAAMAPGSDLIIQGALAYGLMRQLGAIYGVDVRDMDIEHFLDRSRGRFRATTSLTLAVAGNALKAFPGMGTLTGGLTHAVAYSLIFDSIGRAANDALAQHGQLIFDPDSVERHVSENLEQRARSLAALALEKRRSPNDAS